MPDLTTLAIPAFILWLVTEAVAGAVIKRGIFACKDAAASVTMDLGKVFVDDRKTPSLGRALASPTTLAPTTPSATSGVPPVGTFTFSAILAGARIALPRQILTINHTFGGSNES